MSFGTASQRVVIKQPFTPFGIKEIVTCRVDKIVDKKRASVDKWKSFYFMPKFLILSPPPLHAAARLWTIHGLLFQRRA